MAGMVDDATMARLQSLQGAEFDTLWLQSMISHHQGAIEMAKAEVANGQNDDIKRMAQTMIDAQQAEINQMNQMLEGGQMADEIGCDMAIRRRRKTTRSGCAGSKVRFAESRR